MPKSSAYPSLQRVPGKQNWVDHAGGLPDFINRVAKHLHYEKGFTISRAIASAVNTVKKWSSGKNHNGSDVSAATQAKAARAVAKWEAMKVRTKAKKIVEASELSEAEREYLDGYLLGRELAEAGKPWEKSGKDGDDSKGEGMKRCPSCKMKNAKGKAKCWKCKGALAKKGDAKLSEARLNEAEYDAGVAVARLHKAAGGQPLPAPLG